jgi:hypothetical protein
MDLTTYPAQPASRLIRIGDAERQGAAAQLQQHFAAGRLTWEELDERLGLAYAARIHGDLATLFTDLPALAAPRPAAPPTVRRSRRRIHVDLRLVMIVLLALAAVAATRGVLLLPVAWWFFSRSHRRAASRHHRRYDYPDRRDAWG